MTDEEINSLEYVQETPPNLVAKYIDELKNDIAWYKMWHKKFQKQIEELTTELETYRPTKLKGEGQTTCHRCKKIGWTCFGFYHYKGQTLCDKCLKEVLEEERKPTIPLRSKEEIFDGKNDSGSHLGELDGESFNEKDKI